jgi:hypothetical protein
MVALSLLGLEAIPFARHLRKPLLLFLRQAKHDQGFFSGHVVFGND